MIKDTTGYIKINDLVCILVNKTSVITSEIVMSAQRGHGGGGKRKNRGHKYGSLRGKASSLSN